MNSDEFMKYLGTKLKKAAKATADKKLSTGEYGMYNGSAIPTEMIPRKDDKK